MTLITEKKYFCKYWEISDLGVEVLFCLVKPEFDIIF